MELKKLADRTNSSNLPHEIVPPDDNIYRVVEQICKVHIFWEGHKILRNLHLTFDYATHSQKLGEDFAKFCGLLRIYELY